MGVRSVKRKNRFSRRTQKRGGSGREGSGTEDVCPISLNPLTESVGDNSTVTTTNCGHMFHEACLNTWCVSENIQKGGDGDLKTSLGTCTCPICRKLVKAVSTSDAVWTTTVGFIDNAFGFIFNALGILERNTCLFAFILAAACIYKGMKSEAGCDGECIIRELLDLFRTRGGTLESTPTSKTRTSTSKTRTSTSKTRTPTKMRNTIRSKKGSPSMISPSKVFHNNVLPSELLNLKVGSSALKIIKKWILDNIDKVKDEKLKVLINELLKTGEESLSKLSKTNSPTSSTKTVGQFIVENKRQFFDATQAIGERYTKSK